MLIYFFRSLVLPLFGLNLSMNPNSNLASLPLLKNFWVFFSFRAIMTTFGSNLVFQSMLFEMHMTLKPFSTTESRLLFNITSNRTLFRWIYSPLPSNIFNGSLSSQKYHGNATIISEVSIWTDLSSPPQWIPKLKTASHIRHSSLLSFWGYKRNKNFWDGKIYSIFWPDRLSSSNSQVQHSRHIHLSTFQNVLSEIILKPSILKLADSNLISFNPALPEIILHSFSGFSSLSQPVEEHLIAF